MGKIIFKGFVPPDDPMFTEGYSILTKRSFGSNKSAPDDLEPKATESSTSESKGNSKPPVTKE